ncbi:CmcJ/NvfI family oxidoreductase [Psychromonas algicola]|uniref:CmcJ/NvfI family oxidoreductase n=1 Tax=Psychromonas algicola TaxID=2555642 RepID=UPI00106850E9|nr:CmcJ/NvfI family oxidoreductase [Psychromonas sp. RZ5]TEW52661.1 methyltransferase [Psychromonas sp. RZ5]
MIRFYVEKTKLHFIKDESNAVPVISYSGHDESQNYSDDYIFQETEVLNARLLGEDRVFSLDKEAFKLTQFNPTEVDFLDSELVKSSYYADVEALVKKETGATDVFVFDHTVRRGVKDSNRHPAYHVHNDYTFETGASRAVSVLGEEVVGLFAGKRMIQINVWRSIAGVVERDPLALMDATTLDTNDLVRAKISFNDMKTSEQHQGEIFALKKNAKQKWYYYPEMDAGEAILIKGFDTDESRSRFAMHTAFPLSAQGEHHQPRQSIETRTYAFFDV